MAQDLLKECQRIVVKAGTSILTSEVGEISPANLARLGHEILHLRDQQRQVVLVSSGAIAFGMEAAGMKRRPKTMAALQACAAIGQGKLMHAYETFFSSKGIATAQILLTRDGFEDRTRFLAARRTLAELLKMKALPIVNENDTVATEEIAFGDNDVLSVQVAHLIDADLLVLLSDVDGFYLKDKSRIRQVSSIQEIDSELAGHLRDRRKEKQVGGMKAKLAAARTAMRLGVPLAIVNGHQRGVLDRLLQGEDVGTVFLAAKDRKNSRKKWIAFSAAHKGTLLVDSGAYEALDRKNRSLLASGTVGIRGNFDRGQIVELETIDGRVFGRGRVQYSSRELRLILGKRTGQIEGLLGYKGPDEVIHRNDMVLWS